MMEPLEERQLLSVSPRGDQWLVNSYAADVQKLADTGYAVAAMPEGGYVVSWTSADQGGYGKGVYSQRFAADGGRLGDECLVSTTTNRDQKCSSVAVAADGSSVIVWQSSGAIRRRRSAGWW
jgi:hypothetical protein